MAEEQARQLLQRGIAAAQANRPDIAREALQRAVQLDPRNETAWLWLSSVARNDKERIFCLRQLLNVNPNNEHAIAGLQRMGIGAGEPQQATSAAPAAPDSPVPVLSDQRYSRLQQAADEFLRRYNPEPVDHLGIEWVPKHRRRYGEAGAARLRRSLYAGSAIGVLALIVVVVLVLANLNIVDLDKIVERADLPTRIPTQTPIPTLTPTIGGPTPTPFPAVMAVAVTDIPSGLSEGDPYLLMTPTDIYPHIESSVLRPLRTGIDLYSIGAYDEAVDFLDEQREINEPHCYPAIVYYQALAYAGRGDTDQALSVLQQAQAYVPPDPRYENCQDSPLLWVAEAQVRYTQDHTSQRAMDLSTQALGRDPDLLEATLIQARVYLARGQYVEARNVVSQALLDHEEDTNLLLLAAEVEIGSGQPDAALDYIGTTLFIDPDSYAGLDSQTRAFLALADQAGAGQRQEQYYGLAVRSAQTMLIYYAGDPMAYYYLAQARIGEGNDTEAETSLTRIISAGEGLPERYLEIVRDAYLLRADLRYRQGRWSDARSDYLRVRLDDDNQPIQSVTERLLAIALAGGDFREASNQLDNLLLLAPNNAIYRLQQIRLEVELCTLFPESLVSCDYSGALERLTDNFISSLPDEEAQADGYSYRAQASYHDTQRLAATLNEGELDLAYNLALNDVTQALSVRESAVDHYYRGMLLEELGRLPQALEEYRWVRYWGEVYDYPFRNATFEGRVDELASVISSTLAASQASPTPFGTIATPPSITPTPTITLTPTEGPSPTPSATFTPSPSPTATDTATPELAPPAPFLP